MKVTLRDTLWLFLVVGLVLGWWVERSRLLSRPIVGKMLVPDVVDALGLVSRQSSWKLPVLSVHLDGNSGLQVTTGALNDPHGNGGECFIMGKVNGEWQILKQEVWF